MLGGGSHNSGGGSQIRGVGSQIRRNPVELNGTTACTWWWQATRRD